MDYRIPAVILVAGALLACGLGSTVVDTPVSPTVAAPIPPTIAALPTLAAAEPTVAAPATPLAGGTPMPFDTKLPDMRVGESGSGCGPLAADLKAQSLNGTITVFPNEGQDQFRAVTENTHYKGTASMLNGDCQPSGSQYDLTASFGLDYSATLGTSGQARCIRDSQLTLTSFQLQGLPGALNLIARPIVENGVPRLVQPRIDEFIVRRLNGGTLPPSGARCPG
jgi:hypothetical protein